MAEAAPPLPDPLDARLDALAKAAAILDWPLPRERDEAVCREAARVVDALLVRVARGRGALDIALGDALEVLASSAGVFRLGHSGVGDYARERLGIAASTAQKMVRFARKLRERPILRAAVRAGEVTPRAAEAVLPVAHGENEAAWVDLARHQTVRALIAAVKGGAPAADETDEDEKWIRTRAELMPERRAIVDKALDLARKALCATAPKWELVGAMCEEYLGAHEHPAGDSLPPREDLDPIKEWLENESAQWAFLDRPEPIEAPLLYPDAERDLAALDAEACTRAGSASGARRPTIFTGRWSAGISCDWAQREEPFLDHTADVRRQIRLRAHRVQMESPRPSRRAAACGGMAPELTHWTSRSSATRGTGARKRRAGSTSATAAWRWSR
jgi:hypothetical protein